MATPKNAAHVAVQAELCQKQAAGPCAVQLPTVQQAIHLACSVLAESLNDAIKAASSNSQWRDEYQDSITAAEVALTVVEQLKVEAPSDAGTFDTQWWRATSVARLARDAFPDKDSGAWRFLRAAVDEFESLYRVVDFLAIKAEQEGGAA